MLETVPPEEIAARLTGLQARLAEAGVGLALLRQQADLFYYTGTVAEGFLAVPVEGAAALLVRRPQARLAEADISHELVFYHDVKELPHLASQVAPSWGNVLGLELDVIPAAFFLRLQQLFPQAEIKDISGLIRHQRMLKSPYEIEQIRQAAAILDQVFEVVPEFLQPGLTELELAAEVEYRLRLLGHQGLVRLRNLDLEMFFGHVLSGVSGLHLAYTDTPSGGWGFSPAFPQGAGLKRLAPHEPISIDIASCVNGYVADMTRMFAIQEMPARAWEAYELVQDIYRIFESQVRAGVRTKDIYHTIWDEVKRRGRQEYFMGQGPDRVRFLGHGVGLELDEFPLLSARFPYPLEAGMVMAFEPKFFLPEVGMVGQEDTCLITADGVEWLTQAPRRVLVV